MATPEDDKRRQGKLEPLPHGATADVIAESMQRGAALGFLQVRNDLEQRIPNILKLDPVDFAGVKVQVRVFLDYQHPDPKIATSMQKLLGVLEMRRSDIPPKQYEAAVQQVWKVAKANMDEYLSSPEIKKLLEPKASPSKR
jgi:hypothetical protein